MECLVELRRGSDPIFTDGKYITNDLHNIAGFAHDYCSLTYFPRFRYVFEVPPVSSMSCIFGNNHQPFNDLGQGLGFTRAWPAFGSHGGSHELIYTCDREIPLGPRTELKDGGAIDSYHYDNARRYDLSLIVAISKGTLDAISGDEHWESVNGKIQAASGIVLAWTKGDRWYSLSIARKCFGEYGN
jgi:hypothetical protein